MLNTYNQEIQIPYIIFLILSAIYYSYIFKSLKYWNIPIRMIKEPNRLVEMILALGIGPTLVEFIVLAYAEMIAIDL